MKMKTIDTKPFKEMQIDVWSSLMGMEEREIAEVYGKYLSPQELQTLQDIAKEIKCIDFGNNKGRIDYLDFKLVEIMATLAVSSPDFEKKYFRSENPVNHTDFYNLGYQTAVDFIGLDKHRDFLLAMVDEFDTVYLGRLIQYQEGADIRMSLSEWDFYDILEAMSPREVSQLMELLGVDRKAKHKLEKCVSKKEIEAFVNILSSLSPTGYETAAATIKLWYEITLLKKAIPNLLEDTADNRCITDTLYSIIEDRHVNSDSMTVEMVYSMDEEPIAPFQIASLNYHLIYQRISTLYAVLIFLHNNLQYCSTNVESVKRIRRCISVWEYAEELEKWILEEKIDPFGYADSVESLENFKKEFLAELNIPKSIGKEKKSNEYFCYASGKKEIDEVECRKLYKALADERLLEWNEETCFSFMYRMCPSYTPKKDTPSPIIWLGTTRELFNLIWEYYEGSTKIWEKTRKFFHNINGIPPKINGAKNQAISPSARMQRIFDSLK